MNVDSTTALLYHTYNSLFLSLPFQGIQETGTRLALFAQNCQQGLRNGQTPEEIIHQFWDDYYERSGPDERIDALFDFIKYIERQVVLFDAVEDALFEQKHRSNHTRPLTKLLAKLENDEPRRQMLLQKLQSFSLRLVLTAHPTQFYPGKVLGIINDLGQAIQGHDLEQIRLYLMQLGKTAFVNRSRPTPYDEAVSLGWYLENVFYHAIPDSLFRLLKTLGQDVTQFENPRLLELGFWPGGDRDGNPFVDAGTTLLVARRMKEAVLRGYYRDIRLLKRRLTFRGVEEIIAEVEEGLKNTLYPTNPAARRFAHADELRSVLLSARNILLAEHEGLFLDELDLLILKIRVFGFYFASIDIRQNSAKIAETWSQLLPVAVATHPDFAADHFAQLDEAAQTDLLLRTPPDLSEQLIGDPFTRETLQSFKAISTIQKENGAEGCHRYIISNCASALDVARVYALAKAVAPDSVGAAYLDIVPLFETVEDLAEAGAIMDTLYRHPQYSAHLDTRGRVQHIMLGFSDGTKDGGYLRANWSIYRAKENLTRISRAHGVTVIFFDGRGGPPGRGGGNNASYYAAQGKEIEHRAIHVTIQGQTVSSTYGTIAAAQYNIERLLSAGLEGWLFPAIGNQLSDADRVLLDQLADEAYKAYLELKNHPDFVPYLEKMTPLQWYGDTNIASRPTKRNADSALRFEDLRAIPFVGAWAQMKQNIPGYYGLGAALEQVKMAGLEEQLKDLYQHSLFFRTLVENSMQSLSKSNFELTRYLDKHPRFGEFWRMLSGEYERTTVQVVAVSDRKELLADNTESKTSIALREEIVLPLSTIQQFGLQKIASGTLTEEEYKQYSKLILRAMFGIINAARNAA